MKRAFYLFSPGRLRRRQNTLAFERKPAADGRVPRTVVPIEQAEAIFVFGELSINTALVALLAEHQVPVHFFDRHGNYTATLQPREYLHSGQLRVRQVAEYLNPVRRLGLAREFVAASIHNIALVLRYYQSRCHDSAPLSVALERVDAEQKAAAAAGDVATLMGAEGRARQAYYAAWPAILRPDAGFEFLERSRRPPSNPLNALISFGNALCYAASLRSLYRTQLDPTIGYLHEPGARRFSLALDISEAFKPLLVDRTIFRLINKGQLRPADFESRLGGCYLKDRGRRAFIEAWDDRLRQTIHHRRMKRKVSQERLIRLDCYRLVRHLLDVDEDFVAFRGWW
jgi:CRISP-associated protein Cas1